MTNKLNSTGRGPMPAGAIAAGSALQPSAGWAATAVMAAASLGFFMLRWKAAIPGRRRPARPPSYGHKFSGDINGLRLF
jgi:hypothetical protein